MWIFVVATALTALMTIGMVKAAMVRHRKKQQRSMRDHLNRISHTYE